MKNLISLIFVLSVFAACSNIDVHIKNVDNQIDKGNLRYAKLALLNIPINLIDEEGKAKIEALSSRVDSLRNVIVQDSICKEK
tara:strand:+ start:250 stop:498 length:249 start_codon:yes stop_codon:yes gene_type:complete